jgi:hypothetical protein
MPLQKRSRSGTTLANLARECQAQENMESMKNIGRRACRCVVIWAVAAVVVSGCATPQSVSVTVLSADRIEVGRRTVTLNELPGTLQSMRATSSTEIVVYTPDTKSRVVVGAISSKLASSGYRKIMFRGQKRAEAFTEDR